MHTKYTTSAYAGKKFGQLTITEVVRVPRPGTKSTRTLFVCTCDCGNQHTVDVHHLLTGHTTSCGCRVIEATRQRSTTHGKSRTKVYKAWFHMLERVNAKPGTRDYTNYVARGITVCERWLSFENFYADMGQPPTASHSLDRIDNNGIYEPANCQWATKQAQSENRRNAQQFVYNGQTCTIAELARVTGIPRTTLRTRLLVYHMPVEEAVVP